MNKDEIELLINNMKNSNISGFNGFTQEYHKHNSSTTEQLLNRQSTPTLSYQQLVEYYTQALTQESSADSQEANKHRLSNYYVLNEFKLHNQEEYVKLHCIAFTSDSNLPFIIKLNMAIQLKNFFMIFIDLEECLLSDEIIDDTITIVASEYFKILMDPNQKLLKKQYLQILKYIYVGRVADNKVIIDMICWQVNNIVNFETNKYDDQMMYMLKGQFNLLSTLTKNWKHYEEDEEYDQELSFLMDKFTKEQPLFDRYFTFVIKLIYEKINDNVNFNANLKSLEEWIKILQLILKVFERFNYDDFQDYFRKNFNNYLIYLMHFLNSTIANYNKFIINQELQFNIDRLIISCIDMVKMFYKYQDDKLDKSLIPFNDIVFSIINLKSSDQYRFELMATIFKYLDYAHAHTINTEYFKNNLENIMTIVIQYLNIPYSQDFLNDPEKFVDSYCEEDESFILNNAIEFTFSLSNTYTVQFDILMKKFLSKFFENYDKMSYSQLECMINLIISSYDSTLEETFRIEEFKYIKTTFFNDLGKLNDQEIGNINNIRIIFILDYFIEFKDRIEIIDLYNLFRYILTKLSSPNIAISLYSYYTFYYLVSMKESKAINYQDLHQLKVQVSEAILIEWVYSPVLGNFKFINHAIKTALILIFENNSKNFSKYYINVGNQLLNMWTYIDKNYTNFDFVYKYFESLAIYLNFYSLYINESSLDYSCFTKIVDLIEYLYNGKREEFIGFVIQIKAIILKLKIMNNAFSPVDLSLFESMCKFQFFSDPSRFLYLNGYISILYTIISIGIKHNHPDIINIFHTNFENLKQLVDYLFLGKHYNALLLFLNSFLVNSSLPLDSGLMNEMIKSFWCFLDTTTIYSSFSYRRTLSGVKNYNNYVLMIIFNLINKFGYKETNEIVKANCKWDLNGVINIYIRYMNSISMKLKIYIINTLLRLINDEVHNCQLEPDYEMYSLYLEKVIILMSKMKTMVFLNIENDYEFFDEKGLKEQENPYTVLNYSMLTKNYVCENQLNYLQIIQYLKDLDQMCAKASKTNSGQTVHTQFMQDLEYKLKLLNDWKTIIR